ncbi:MAG: DsbA family protein [Candidatus Nanohaloarchaea archaeon]
MPSCEFCDEDFDSKTGLHLHWGEEHEDELNSHQKEKVKKARREHEEQKKEKMARRKQMAGWGLAGVAGLAVVAFLAMNMIGSSSAPQQSSTFQLDQQPMMGSENASVTVVEFGDYRCPFCKRFETNVFPRLKEEYIDTGQVKFYFINYAFLGPGSTQAAVAGECVNRQSEEQFWDFHRALYENQGPESEQWVTSELLMNVARNHTEGLDYDQLKTCINNQKTLSSVRSDLRIGRNNQVTSTPTVFVNGKSVSSWNYAAVKAAIERELN